MLLVEHLDLACKKLSDDVLGLLCVCSKLLMICKWSRWCHCHPTISYFIKTQIALTFLVSACPGFPGKQAVKWLSVYGFPFVDLLQVWLVSSKLLGSSGAEIITCCISPCHLTNGTLALKRAQSTDSIQDRSPIVLCHLLICQLLREGMCTIQTGCQCALFISVLVWKYWWWLLQIQSSVTF